MKILVVGGTRFFGLPMVRKLIDNGHSVTIATRGGHSDPFGDSVRRVIMDKTDTDSVKAALGGEQFDLLIDKVAYSSNDVISLLSGARCKRYIQMSSCAVYETAHTDIAESEFCAKDIALVRMDRTGDYALGKRQAERAALEMLDESACTFVRYPVVLGENDYTGRLRAYVKAVACGTPMNIKNPDAKTAYIFEDEAGGFIAHLADTEISGAVNGCAVGTVSQSDIIGYIEHRCGKKAVFSQGGEKMPYDDTASDTSYSCARAKGTGFVFGELTGRLYALLDDEIDKLR